METSEVLDAVFRMDVGDLNRVTDAVKLRRKQFGAATFASLQPGDPVTIASTVRPKYLVGATGKVREKRQTKVVVDLDEPHGRFHRGVICPADMLELAL